MKRFRIREINIVALSTAFTVICSWITVPGAVPYTLQSYAIFTISALMGHKYGFWTVLTYILLGVAGIPVFAGARAGVGVLFGETGGYLLGFLVGVAVCGIICEKYKSTAVMFAAMLIGTVLCYVSGCLWIIIIYHGDYGEIGIWAIIARYVAPFVIPDIVKILLAVFTVKAVRKRKMFNF